jgi:hypothetical protein
MIFTPEAIEGFKRKITELTINNEKYRKILDAIDK